MQHNQRKLNAYIRGAYGPGNLGDDVLLEVCINILLKYFDESKISVGLYNPKNPGYFSKYRCRFRHISAPASADLLIYGGGGQFFEFKNSSSTRSIIHKIINTSRHGLNRHDLAKILINKLLRRGNISFKKSASICLGLGPFENSESDSIKHKISPFLKCDYKSVRDIESFQISEKYVSGVKTYTDPTFLVNHWLGSRSILRANKGNSIGVILRRWDLSEHGRKAVLNTIEAARLLISSGIVVTLISLYSDYDKELISELNDFNWKIWDPNKQTPDIFIEDIAKNFDILISTRAHGVLLPAQTGVPSVVIGIEPKLKNIHKLLPNGTLYCDGDDPYEIFKLAKSCLHNRERLERQLKSDVETQKIISEKFLDDFNSWLNLTIEKLQ
ncbi:polysaccharide pyruvyl transferase family protein [Pseudomonas nitroreducens]|uniref:Polysaccharide pyruvyl transferase domain-containing protein n=1 Tax=Pseudomonas nitroreducens TaxID=46680 RepID=A0A2D0AEQ6_PSENT|nr:polysaccharide pyruvyl transferase family protein [Pseudomonas nitroreducens]OWP50547.1 hypothetical protein CEG18_13470 [Pseudomonas nitroreducens]